MHQLAYAFLFALNMCVAWVAAILSGRYLVCGGAILGADVIVVLGVYVTDDSGEDNVSFEEDLVEKGEACGVGTSGEECCVCLSPYREGERVIRIKNCEHALHLACKPEKLTFCPYHV